MWPPASHAQIAKPGGSHTRQSRPAIPAILHVSVQTRAVVLRAVGRGHAGPPFVGLKPRGPGSVVDDAAKGIRSIHHAVGPEDDLGLLQNVRVDGDGILQVATSVDRIVHPDAIDHQQDAICLKATDDGGSTALLTLLDQNGPRRPQQLRRCFRGFNALHRFNSRGGQGLNRRRHGGHVK